MPRPFKHRRVRGRVNASLFKPSGIPGRNLERTILSMDEFEAIRLKDVKNLDQIECAKKMEISQSTFHRILNRAHKKISSAIVLGKAIEIENGENFQN